MKIAFLFLICIAVAFAAPPQHDAPASPPIAILKQSYNQEPEGSYQFNYETENQITREESGSLKTVKDEDGKDTEALVVKGSYSYPGPDGVIYTVTYTADENGFHPEGEHIPKVPGAK